ncbi:MAG: aldo/keto reductase [Planctomycetes bacterium SM23_32]|nr:MAG: aldo/keto reductase [Planctomycetes bacterium SM23_32]
MEYARLGGSDVEVSRVIFGAWAIGGWKWGGTDDEEAVAAIRRAVELGVNTIDTAPMYGFGHSESVVGRAVRGMRDRVVIATKCGLRWDRTDGERYFDTEDADGRPATVYRCLKPDAVLEEIDQSLERLGVDCVDLYQCHWPDSTTPIQETMEALNQILQKGKARAVGLSNFSAEMTEEARRHAPIASDQPLYNMLDRDAEANLLPYCADNGVGVICYSPLHQALLTGKVTMERTFGGDDIRPGKPWFRPQNRRRALEFLDRIRPIAEKHGKTLAQTAINWCLCQRGVTAAIVGARRPEQVEENAGGAGWSLDDEDLAAIRTYLDELGGPTQ